MNRLETQSNVKRWDIPKSKLAHLADVQTGRVSEYMQNKTLPEAVARRIQDAVSAIVRVRTVFLPYPGVVTDLSDRKKFWNTVRAVDAALDEWAQEWGTTPANILRDMEKHYSAAQS